MIVQKDFLNKLKDFGLNSYESKLWIALLSRGVSTAGELSDISNVPRSRAYDVLESLEKKGFIVVKIGKPIKYLAVPPPEVVERVKKKVNEEADQQTGILNKLKKSELLEELNTLHTQGVQMIDPTDKSGAFRGRNKIYEHLGTMIKNAQKTIVISTTKAGLERKHDSLHAALKKASQRGVQIKISAPGNINKEVLDKFSKIATLTGNAKNPARFCLVDNNQMLVFLTDDKNIHKSYDSAIWVEAPHFVAHINELFR